MKEEVETAMARLKFIEGQRIALEFLEDQRCALEKIYACRLAKIEDEKRALLKLLKETE